MKSIFTLLFFAASIAVIAQAGETMAAFTPGNIVVYRVGDGLKSLKSSSTFIFLDEYTPTGTLVQSVAIPRKTTTSAGLVAQGTTTSEGLINRTADGRYLLVPGYSADTGVAMINNSSSSTVPRGAGRADAGGTLAITTFGPSAFNTGGIRCAASADGSTLYLAGSNTGIRKAVFGDTATVRINAAGSGTPANFRAVNIFGGQLYASAASTYKVAIVGTGVPTDSGAAVTNLPGIPSTLSPTQFFFADLNAAVPGFDVLYIADNGGSATTGIQKYSLVGGTWVSNGKASPTVAGPTGLTGTVSGTTVKLYTTSGSTNNTTTILYSLSDATGYNQTIAKTFVTVATAATNTAFRGVALAPESSNPSFDTDYFRSKATGNWNSTATWESSADSINWHAATLTPGALAASIVIRSPHVVTVTAAVIARKPTVNTGGTLNVNNGVVLTTK